MMPVHINDIYYEPEKQFCGLYVAAKIAVPDFDPTLELLAVLNESKVCFLSISSHRSNDVVHNFVTLDLTDKPKLKEEIVEKVSEKFGSRLTYLECADSGVPGLIFNVNGYPVILNLSGRPLQVAAMTTTGWKNLVMGMIRRYGADATLMLWNMGSDFGEAHGKILADIRGLSDRNRIRIGLAVLQALGWGKFELTECDEFGKLVVIRATENFEELITREMLDYENRFLLGFFVGLVSRVFDKACRGTEVKCTKLGDPYCEFVIR
ncbi:MAG: 4-vinyl reductase [Candidatus Verstraetearchaeota archaeon]|nr:4-vinyl reductase [Candidatus Verstraetearchaeota archaeon]